MDVGSHASSDAYPVCFDPKGIIQKLNYCQTDVAIIGHVARCCLDCGEWIVRAIDESLLREQSAQFANELKNGSSARQRDPQFSESLRAIRLVVRQDVEYVRRRTMTLVSQVQQIRDRAQSQTNFVSICRPALHCHMTANKSSQMLSTITQSDAQYTAAIAVDGKKDSIAMKTISVLGIVFLPPTFVATLFSINMFDWGVNDDKGSTLLKVSPSMWIYWAISVPLTLVTFAVWLLWARKENEKSRKRLMIFRSKTLAESESSAAASIAGFVSCEKIV